MRLRFSLLMPLIGLCVCGALSASDLAVLTLAKFLRVLVQSTGTKAVGCENKELAGELSNLGVLVEKDAEAKVVWVDSAKELSHLVKEHKFVVCGDRGLLAEGACLALVAEGGWPVIYRNAKSITASGITLPDAILKISKVAK